MNIKYFLAESSGLPLLVSTNTSSSSKTDADVIIVALTQTITEASVITSMGYLGHYRGGVAYSWILDFTDVGFIKVIFTNISFNIYEVCIIMIYSFHLTPFNVLVVFICFNPVVFICIYI